ncbi:MAG: hypothetical protein Q9185_001927 [Variospora sp. 1 TL-2023]
MDESVVRRRKDEKFEECNSVGLCSKRIAGHRSLMRSRLKKACDSLKSCPLPMIHPSEAQALNGFGPKTCERLEKRLREHCEENGLPMPKRKSRKRMSDSIEEPSLDMTPAKKPRKTTKSYVPQLRSGPYAILLALASISETEMVSKQQLIEMAQQHCDASFVAPKDATSYHTAWSSMKTLLNKDLVKETKGPQKRYELTDEGWEVAEKIKKAGKAEEGSGVDNAHGREETRLEKADNKTTTVGQKDKGRSNNKQRRKENTSSFSVPHVTIDIDDTDSSMSKGTTRHRPPLVDRTDLNTSLSSVRPAQRLGGLMNEKYATMALAKTSKSTQGSSTTVQASSGQDHTNTRLERNAYLAARIQPDEQDHTTTSDDVNFFELLSSSPPVAAHLIQSRNQVTLSNTGEPSAKAISEPLSRPELPQSHPLPTTYTPPAFQPIILSPSTFTLELILDNREIRSREDRTYIETELLQKHSIRPLIRSLPLGDFFWVAKLKDPTLLARQYGEEAGDLIALDYIVERKRLDDLIASIKDGRFREQKFRLHRSGVSNVVYLVEEIGLSQDTKTKYWAAMQTAVASTQVVDGFTVKRTKGLDESIRYLARMTRLLKSIYEVVSAPFLFLFLSRPP